MSDMLSRRDVVTKLAVGTAAACALGAARTGLAATRHEEVRAPLEGDHGPEQAATDAPPPPAPHAPEAQPAIAEAKAPSTPSAPPPCELIDPLAMGSAVAHGWRVAGLSGAADGSCVLSLQNDRGRTHRVHICRNNGRPQGLVYTRRFDLVVMNGGQGDLPTEEGFAQAVGEVAHVLAANERHPRHATVVAALLPHTDRLQRFGSAAKLR